MEKMLIEENTTKIKKPDQGELQEQVKAEGRKEKEDGRKTD
ncbi:hypothetical protein EUBC25_24540 [Claveliimonas bilis]|nr:hypothetical protein [Claveliimonas bilis]BCZ28367.1 hypothetical protein EUBC25_24540 [Claveliimonas bilis]